jgi:hypothetical protein
MLAKLAYLSSMLVVSAFAAPSKLMSIPAEEFGLNDVKFSPGVTASMEIDVLQQAANVWFDSIISVVNGLEIPDFDLGDKNYMK